MFSSLGCNFGPSSKIQERTAIAQSKGTANHPERRLDGGKYCLETMMQNPTASMPPMHFSYKETESDGSSKDYEADLAGDTFDVTSRARYRMDPALLHDIPNPPALHDGFAEDVQTSHYTRAESAGWIHAWGGMVNAATPWSLFILHPNATPAGPENIAGFETIKYVVDTAQQSRLEKLPGTTGWGVKDYQITGSAWATKDTGCILTYSIDLEKDAKDGSQSKAHYEGAITKR